jgi:hypothetical protein
MEISLSNKSNYKTRKRKKGIGSETEGRKKLKNIKMPVFIKMMIVKTQYRYGKE